MAAAEPETHIYQLVDMLARQIKRLGYVFWDGQFNYNIIILSYLLVWCLAF